MERLAITILIELISDVTPGTRQEVGALARRTMAHTNKERGWML
jgi:hypothetical protein